MFHLFSHLYVSFPLSPPFTLKNYHNRDFRYFRFERNSPIRDPLPPNHLLLSSPFDLKKTIIIEILDIDNIAEICVFDNIQVRSYLSASEDPGLRDLTITRSLAVFRKTSS